MGRQAIWTGQDLDNLLTKPLDELEEIYTQFNKNHLRATRRYWTNKLKEREKPMPNHENPNNQKKVEQVGDDVVSTVEGWYEVVTKDAEGVAHTHRLYKHSTKTKPNPVELAEIFEPATPAKITPTRRKRAEKVGRKMLVFGDSQIGYHRVYDAEGNDSLIPTHSEEALSVLTQINAHERPDEVVNLSDTVDFAEMSRFDPASDSFHRTLGPALQRAHNLYAQLRADNPDAKITEVDSNHTARVQKRVMSRMPEMYGLRLPGEQYPIMSYFRLANLGGLAIDFVSGYGAAEYVYGEEYDTPPIIFKHGTTTASAPGATVRKESGSNPTTHVVRGHGHSFEHIAQTTRQGETLHYMQLGTTCATNGNVPSYHSAMDDFGQPVHNQENWQQQLLMINDVEGRYSFDVIDIVRGIASYRGRTYDGNEGA